MNDDESDPIIGFRKSQNKINMEYRIAFGIDASHLLALRTL